MSYFMLQMHLFFSFFIYNDEKTKQRRDFLTKRVHMIDFTWPFVTSGLIPNRFRLNENLKIKPVEKPFVKKLELSAFLLK